MTFSGDPFRTLGLPPGASQDQVKRAYRQLAKRYHPDSAGESALPRFLAIQAAYDMLTGSTRPSGARTPRPGRPGGTPGGGTGGARPGTSGPTGASGPAGGASAGGPTGGAAAGSSGRPSGGRTSQADANRANATRDAYRARRARTAHASGAAPGRGAGAAPGAAWAREGPPGRTPGAGPNSTGSDAPPRPADGAAGGAASAGGGGAAADGASAGRSASANSGRSGPGAASHGRDGRRARRTATLGSTSYDDAPHDPEPAWGGATWYGGSSGTYWTINPKEFADPRKHGPEYLARGRRFRAAAAASTNGAGPDPDDTSWDDDPEPARTPDGPGPDAQPGAPPAGPASGPAAGSSGPRAEPRSAPADAAADQTARRPPQPTWTTGGFASSAGPGDHRTGFAAAGAGIAGDPAAPAAARFTYESDPDDDDLLAHPFDAPIAQRVLLALIAWPPIGLAAGALIGNATGCDRYAATCSPEASTLGWIVQPAIVALLLLLPVVARPAAIASIAVGVGAVIGATVLSIAGGAKDPTHAAQSILVAILVMAYAVGLIGALSGRIRLPRWLRQPT